MTSISDRCKTAREKATPGPWTHDDVPGPGEDPMRSTEVYPQGEYGAIAYVQPNEADVSLIALAPEAADEVVRLTDALEDLAERFGVQIMRANDLNNEEMRYMATAAQAMIWKILNENGDTND